MAYRDLGGDGGEEDRELVGEITALNRPLCFDFEGAYDA